MDRTRFTDKEIEELRNNQYVYTVTSTRVAFTREFKQIFYDELTAGNKADEILEDHGIDPDVIVKNRVRSAREHILKEYKKHGCFCEGYGLHGHRKAFSGT